MHRRHFSWKIIGNFKPGFVLYCKSIQKGSLCLIFFQIPLKNLNFWRSVMKRNKITPTAGKICIQSTHEVLSLPALESFLSRCRIKLEYIAYPSINLMQKYVWMMTKLMGSSNKWQLTRLLEALPWRRPSGWPLPPPQPARTDDRQWRRWRREGRQLRRCPELQRNPVGSPQARLRLSSERVQKMI